MLGAVKLWALVFLFLFVVGIIGNLIQKLNLIEPLSIIYGINGIIAIFYIFKTIRKRSSK